MYQKSVKLSSVEMSNLYYFCLNNNKFFLMYTNKNKYKYFTIPSCFTFQKDQQTFIFSSELKDQTFLNSYVTSFIFWIKQNNKTFKKKLLLKGLGFRAYLSDDKSKICFKIGFSHIIALSIPKNINNIIIEKNYITVEGDNIALVGNFCRQIKSLKLPDSYKGKGFLYKNEVISLKPIKKN